MDDVGLAHAILMVVGYPTSFAGEILLYTLTTIVFMYFAELTFGVIHELLTLRR